MRMIFASFLGALAVASAVEPVYAQAGIVLGERPVARAEVAAFVRKQFARMDTNRNGHISAAECEVYRARQGDRAQNGLGHVGRRWFPKTDANADGKVTLEEALARPIQMFDMADVNRDGIASVREQSFAQLLLGN